MNYHNALKTQFSLSDLCRESQLKIFSTFLGKRTLFLKKLSPIWHFSQEKVIVWKNLFGSNWKKLWSWAQKVCEQSWVIRFVKETISRRKLWHLTKKLKVLVKQCGKQKCSEYDRSIKLWAFLIAFWKVRSLLSNPLEIHVIWKLTKSERALLCFKHFPIICRYLNVHFLLSSFSKVFSFKKSESNATKNHIQNEHKYVYDSVKGIT